MQRAAPLRAHRATEHPMQRARLPDSTTRRVEALLGELHGDPPNAQPLRPQLSHALLDGRRNRPRPPQPHAGSTPLRERVARALADQPPLELSEHGHHPSHRLAAANATNAHPSR
jgi:hypothetical protein